MCACVCVVRQSCQSINTVIMMTALTAGQGNQKETNLANYLHETGERVSGAGRNPGGKCVNSSIHWVCIRSEWTTCSSKNCQSWWAAAAAAAIGQRMAESMTRNTRKQINRTPGSWNTWPSQPMEDRKRTVGRITEYHGFYRKDSSLEDGHWLQLIDIWGVFLKWC